MRWLRLLRCTLVAAVNDDLLDWSAALSFYFLFALFPTILLIAALLGALHLSGLTQSLVLVLTHPLPAATAAVLSKQLGILLQRHVPGLVSLGWIMLLYSGSQGFSGLMAALNAAYEVPETRPYWRRVLIALGLTFSAGLAVVLALAMLLLGQHLLALLAGPALLTGAVVRLWPLIRWAVTLGFMLVAVRLLYRYAPNTSNRSSGAFAAVAFALTLWFLASALFAAYVDRFSRYSAVYGSLAAIIALMLWLYIFALSLLLGAELHNEWLKQRGLRLTVRSAPRGRAA